MSLVFVSGKIMTSEIFLILWKYIEGFSARFRLFYNIILSWYGFEWEKLELSQNGLELHLRIIFLLDFSKS